MKEAGFYNRPFTRLVRTTTIEDKFGEHQPDWIDDSSVYWGHLEQTSTQDQANMGKVLNTVYVTVTFRNEVPVSVQDHLTDGKTDNEIWLTGVRITDDETICEGWFIAN